MMKVRSLILFMLLFLLTVEAGRSQCVTGTLVTPALTPTTAWQLTGTINARTYRTFYATINAVYEFSFCSAQGGGSSTFDTELTIANDATGAAVPGGFNDDFCGTRSYLSWTCPLSGTYRIYVSKKPCANQTSIGNMAYRFSGLSCPSNLGMGVANVASLPYASGAGTTQNRRNDLTASNTITCGSSTYLSGEDSVWVFTPTVSGIININLTATNTNNGLKLYAGCPLLGAGGTCVANGTGQNVALTNICVTAGTTYYLILDVSGTPTFSTFSNLTISSPASCSLGTGVVSVASLPYSSTGRTTCGKVNDLTSSNIFTCGNNNYLTGEDEVFVFTPTSSGVVTIDITSTGRNTGLALYQGCPLSCGANTCLGYEQSTSGNKSICAVVSAGVTYYLIVDSWSTPSCNPYSINISAPASSLSGSTCANAVVIPSFPFVATGETTRCRGNDYTNATGGSCMTPYESGEDKVYSYTATGSECIGITLTGASSNSIGYQVYSTCPGILGPICVGSAGGASNGTLSGTVTLPSAGTYYIIIDNQAAPSYVNYNLSITSFGAGVPNDQPCNAIALTAGQMIVGSSTCSGSAGEPAAPSCWGPGGNVRNTVWYKFVAPASGKIRVRVVPITVTNPQAALYSGTCGAGMTIIACNNDTTSCGTTTNYSADLYASGLVAGNTYYIAVDGYDLQTGTFGILAIDGASPLPALSNGQDCGTYIQICDTTSSFGNPGFQSFGNICDFTGAGANCLDAGERGSAWFEVTVANNGFLEFTIVPKDWGGTASTPGSETDYDFAVWKTFDGTVVTTTCTDIAAGAVPVACNYSPLGVTGVYGATNGTAPPNYPGFGGAFAAQIPVVIGEKYIIVVSNWATSTSGFDISFSNTAPLQYGISAPTSYWSGGVDNDWFRKENWGGCALPACNRDAVVNGGIILQPRIAAAGATAKNVIINPGASINLQPGFNLGVCGNFINNGAFTTSATSTVNFVGGSFNQNIDGNLISSNALGKVTVTKTGGTVKMLQDVDVLSNFLVSNGSSTFSLAGKKIKVGGDFTNNGTFIPGTSGTLELNGSIGQTYYNFNTLENAIINNSSSAGVTLTSDMELSSTGVMQLQNGIIHTDPFNEVRLLNRSPSAVTGGSVQTYVQGRLRRYINSLGAYNFPLGIDTIGYQRALIDFNDSANPTLIDNILGSFQAYSSTPAPLGLTDCGVPYSDTPLDNGYWTFFSSNNPESGEFDLSLYNTGFTNGGSAHHTLMADYGFGWSLANGVCTTSTASLVRRIDVTGLDGAFGTAQGPSPLPVELLSFNAYPMKETILLNWQTLSEKENRGFEIYRSDGSSPFQQIGWVNGAGNSHELNAYAFTDVNVEENVLYYYRLRQMDYDGKATWSEIATARITGKPFSLQVAPVPAGTGSVIRFSAVNAEQITLKLFSLDGKLIQELTRYADREGVYEVRFEELCSGHLTAGVYFLSLQSDLQSQVIRILAAKD